MGTVLTTLFLNCQSERIEYIEKPYIPELNFPVFPILADAQKNIDGTVSVSGDWIMRLAEYKIRIEETEKTYNDLKALYAREE